MHAHSRHRTARMRGSTRLAAALAGLALAAPAGDVRADAGALHRELEDRYEAAVRESRPLAEASPDSVFAGASVLEREGLLRAVLARNAGLDAAREGWRAALAVYPQSTALEDPVVSYSLAPGSIDSDMPYGQEITLRQMIPFPGKRGLAGESATAQAEASEGEFEAMRLEIAAMASNLFNRYYLAFRAAALNQEHQRFLEELRAAANARYAAGSAPLGEPLAAEVEATHLLHEGLDLHKEERMIRAELNALLHRPPDAALPPPPDSLAVPAHAPLDERAIRERAFAERPELRAAQAEVRALRAMERLAVRESYPDLALMGSYNSMWPDPEHRWMVGVELSLPLQLGRRSGAREEARARLAQAESRRREIEDRIGREVSIAAAGVEESAHVVDLYVSRLLPASRDQAAAARSGFAAGQVMFPMLIEAERNLRTVEQAYEEALVDYYRYRTDLARAVGRLPLGEGVEP